MEFLLRNPQWFAYIAGSIFPLTCFISYVLALSLNHIGPVITYISDAATDPPISGVFGMFLTYSMLSFGIVTFLRHKLVQQALTAKPEIATSRVLMANKISGWLALISVVCLICVAHFQVSSSLLVHGSTACVGIGLGVVYCCMQVICTKAMVPAYCTPQAFYLRLILAALSVLAYVFGFLAGLLSLSKFTGSQMHRWLPEDGGYMEHAFSSVCEWVLAVVYAAYVMSYAHEFKNMRIRAIQVVWMGSENEKMSSGREEELA